MRQTHSVVGVVSAKRVPSVRVASVVLLRSGVQAGRVTKAKGSCMQKQGLMKFGLPRQPREANHTHAYRERIFNGEGPRGPSRDELLAELLKAHAKRVMADVSECDPLQLPAHLSRLDGLRELFCHFINLWFHDTREAALSGRQLQHPSTLADYLRCLELTRQRHRAPAFINDRDAQLARIERKLDLFAGLLARSPALSAILDAQDVEVDP